MFTLTGVHLFSVQSWHTTCLDLRELQLRQTKIDALTHEIRLLRHLRFGARAEAMDSEQAELLEEANEEDLGAARQALGALSASPCAPAQKPRPVRQALPAHLSRIDFHHEPVDTTCGCGQAMKRLSQDISGRLWSMCLA